VEVYFIAILFLTFNFNSNAVSLQTKSSFIFFSCKN